MNAEVELRRSTSLEVAKPSEVTLAGAIRLVLPPPAPGERYHLHGLTKLWAEQVAGAESEHTRRSYETGLAQWLDYCLRSRVDPLTARRADVDDWLATHLNSKNPQTVNARLSAVGSWYGYLLDNDIDVRDPTARVKRPKRNRGKSKTLGLDEAELNAFLAEADRRLEAAKPVGGLALEIAARDVAVLRTLYTTAVRSGAVQLATVADVRLVEDGHRVLRFHGKGDGGETTDRLKPLVPYAAAAVDYYLGLVAERLDIPADQLEGQAFRTTPSRGRTGGRGLRSDALIEMIRTMPAAAGIVRTRSPSSARTPCGTPPPPCSARRRRSPRSRTSSTTPTPAPPAPTYTPTSPSTPPSPTAPPPSSTNPLFRRPD